MRQPTCVGGTFCASWLASTSEAEHRGWSNPVSGPTVTASVLHLRCGEAVNRVFPALAKCVQLATLCGNSDDARC